MNLKKKLAKIQNYWKLIIIISITYILALLIIFFIDKLIPWVLSSEIVSLLLYLILFIVFSIRSVFELKKREYFVIRVIAKLIMILILLIAFSLEKVIEPFATNKIEATIIFALLVFSMEDPIIDLLVSKFNK